MPLNVLVIYAALAVWLLVFAYDLRRRQFSPSIYFGVGLMLYLNIGYFLAGASASIANFVAIYDVLINVGLVSADEAAAVTTCANNACSVWGDTFTNHPAWGVAFYERFANGPEFRSMLLYGHILFNSLAFVLLHVQILRPGFAAHRDSHRLLGRISFLFLTISVVCAVWLASQHGSVSEYGGLLSQYGFYSMAACVYATAIMGIVAIRSKDTASHRKWMFRYAGSMWGSFWLFRVMLFVIDPLLREFQAAAILICIWFSAPLGIVIAELIRRRLDQSAGKKGVIGVPA